MPVLVVGSLLLGLPVAMGSLLVAAIIAAVAVLLILLGLGGLDRTSVWIMVAAFALAPSDKLVLPGIEFLGVSDALFFLSIGLALPRLMARRIWLPPIFVISAMVFAMVSVVASLQSSSPGESYYYCARVIFTVIGIPALLVWWSPRGRVLVALILAYAVGTGASGLVGLPEMGSYRNFGLTQHPNALGYTAVLTLSLLPFLMKRLTSPHRSWICVTVFGIALLGIMTSGSRAALVVALVLLILVPAAERSILATITVLGSGLVAISVFGQRAGGTGEGQDALSRLLGAGDVAGSDLARVEGVEKVWALALEHPFLGSGFTFSDFIAHNIYVQIAAAAGFLGLAAFVVICVSMITPLAHLRRRPQPPGLSRSCIPYRRAGESEPHRPLYRFPPGPFDGRCRGGERGSSGGTAGRPESAKRAPYQPTVTSIGREGPERAVSSAQRLISVGARPIRRLRECARCCRSWRRSGRRPFRHRTASRLVPESRCRSPRCGFGRRRVRRASRPPT